MSQFRIKNIDNGLIDSWLFRINDQGIIQGDDVVAQDPNELAQAISDTQDLIVKTGTYSPNVLIHPTEGVLSRIKTIEDTFGTTTLQNAYDNGRFISVQPGRPLSLGAIGEIELDSSGNLKIQTNTFRVSNGSADLNLSFSGATSSNSHLTFGTLVNSRDTTVRGGRELYLRDMHLTSAVPLSSAGNIALVTAAQSIIGAINEISSGFSGTDLQQIYNQSSPALITTSFSGGPVQIVNGSGNPNTPALQIQGGIDALDFIDADKLTIGPGVAVNLTIESSGQVDTVGDIKTTTKFIAPRLENPTGELTLLDIRGSLNITEIGEGSLDTVKQSLFGAINEVNTLALANASNLAILDLEHDLVTGRHDIINTQSGIGLESTSRFNVKDSGGVTRIAMNALGEITAVGMTLGIYNVITELAANVAHRANDGTSHSAVAAHFAAANPHNTVKSVAKFGDTALSGVVTFSEGAGITLTRAGQNIEIATSSGNTLQSVYNAQVSGDLNLDTTGGKNLNFKDSSAVLVMSLKSTAIEMNKNLSFLNAGATIGATAGLGISAVSNLSLSSSTGGILINTPSIGQTTTIEGVAFTNGDVSVSLNNSLPQDIVGAINNLAQNEIAVALNGTGVLVEKGTAVVFREDGSFWIPYPDASEASALLETPLNSDLYWHGVGVADEDISAGATGRIRTSGRISAAVGEMDIGVDWRPGDAMYVSRVGRSRIKVVSNSLLNNNDTITFDTAGAAKLYTAKSSAANPIFGEFNISTDPNPNAASDITRNNLIATLNNASYMALGNDFFIRAFLSGETAKGRALVTAVGGVGNTITLTPGASVPGQTIVLTAVANGTVPGWLQYELGTTHEETAVNISDAINRTKNFDGPDPLIAGDGHNCSSSAFGRTVEIKWAGPGKMGNSLGLSTTGGNVTVPANLSGGTSEIEVFRSDRSANGILCTQSNAPALTCQNFTDDEGTSQFINQTRWWSGDRERKDDDRRIKIGRVLEWASPLLTFMVEVEAPRKNKVSIRGVPNDTEY